MIRTLPELDNNNHSDLGISLPGFYTHYIHLGNELIFKCDEYELYVNNDDSNRKIVGMKYKGNNVIFDNSFIKQIDNYTEKDKDKIIEMYKSYIKNQ